MSNVTTKGNITVAAPFSIRDLQKAYGYFASMVTARPWAHHSKKGPGRKHQQTKTLTKAQRLAQ